MRSALASLLLLGAGAATLCVTGDSDPPAWDELGVEALHHRPWQSPATTPPLQGRSPTPQPPARDLPEPVDPRAPVSSPTPQQSFLEGELVDARGWGVAGASLKIHFQRSNSTSYPVHVGTSQIQSDALGNFRLPVPERARWAYLAVDGDEWLAPSTRVDISPMRSWPRVHMRVRPAATIEGRVIDADGRPVQSLAVGSRDLLARWARTDEDGAFRFQLPADLVHTQIRVPPHTPRQRFCGRVRQAPAHSGIVIDGIAPGRQNLTIRLPDLLTLCGHAVTPAGRPICCGAVALRRLDDGPYRSIPRTENLVGGAFRIRNLVPGQYLIAWRGAADEPVAGHVRVNVPGDPVVVPCVPAIDLEIALDGPASDRPCFVQWVQSELGALYENGLGPPAWPSHESKVRRGRFKLRGIEDLPISVYVHSGEHCVLLEDVPPSRVPRALSLRPGRAIEGRVVGISAYRQAIVAHAERGFIRREARVRPDGRFRIAGLPAGPYTLRLRGRRWEHHGGVVQAGTRNLVLAP